MNKDLARDIVNILSSPAIVEVLSAFADAQIEKAKKNLVGAQDMETVRREQGFIRAQEELKKIRDTAVQVMKQEK